MVRQTDETSSVTSLKAMTSPNNEDGMNGFLSPSPPKQKIRRDDQNSPGKENQTGCRRKEEQMTLKTPNYKKMSPGKNDHSHFHGGIVYK